LKSGQSATSHAARVAGVATGVGMVSFVIVVLVLNAFLVNRMTSQVDQRLRQRLSIVELLFQQNPSASTETIPSAPGDRDYDDAPILVWSVRMNGAASALSSPTPSLPALRWSNGFRTFSIAQSTFRFDATAINSGWLVDAESLADVQRLQNTLELAELIAGFVLGILMFGAAFGVGVRALAPVSLAKRRQSEFVADASHELRTPLSVIEAEVDLALSRDRDGAGYRRTLEQIKSESSRLKDIVEDLLWLARSDEDQRRPPPLESINLASVTALCCQRFQSLAATHDISMAFEDSSETVPWILASNDLIDRLIGVLIDNALKFAGHGGRVEISVSSDGDHATLRVDDSGPGVAMEERTTVFERFHHSDSTSGGTGLGLAIAESIAQITNASYAVTTADLGGARFEFSWRASKA